MNAHYADGVNNYLNSNHMRYEVFGTNLWPIFAFWKISAKNLRIMWRHLLTEQRNVYCVVKHTQSSNRWQKQR